MKKIFLLIGSIGILTIVGCGSNENESEEVIVKDSMGVTTAPVTDQVDSAAADTLSSTASPQATTPAATETTADGVQITTQNYESASGQKAKAEYMNKEQMHVLNLEVDGGEPIKMMQTEAWAKGAEYSDGKNKWRAEGDNATLTKDGKETKFTVKK